MSPETTKTGARSRKLNPDILVSAAAVLPDDASRIEPFVLATLDVLRRNYAYCELLLVDNGLPIEVHAWLGELQRHLPNVRLLRLSRAYDMEVALAAALDHCIGDFVVMLDADHPAELLPALVDCAANGCDSVSAVPTNQRETFADRWLIRPIYAVASKGLGFPLKPDESHYKVFSRRLVNSIVRVRSRRRYLGHLNAMVGLRHGIVPYTHESKKAPVSSTRRVFRHLTDVSNILVSNSAAPLRFASMLGLLACGLNVLYFGYILAVSFLKSRITEGWLTTSLTQTSMFLALFVIMTIVSEYIARILDETKEQPLYFVECETNSTVYEMKRERLNVVQEEQDSLQPGTKAKSETAGAS